MSLIAKKVESANGPLNIIGTLSGELKNWASANISSSGLSLNLFRGTGESAEMVSLVFSKNLGKAMAEGQVTLEQVKHCNILDGKNAGGEQRYYLVLQGESINLKEWDAAVVAAPVRKAFKLPAVAASQAEMAL